MKKILIYVLILSGLTACSQKKEYEQAVLEEMQKDKDIIDYKIIPEKITDCVVTTSSQNMPGMIPFDPERLTAYKNYTKMLKLHDSPDPKKILEELRTDFGSAKDLAEAHANYTESVVNCVSGLVTSTEEKK